MSEAHRMSKGFALVRSTLHAVFRPRFFFVVCLVTLVSSSLLLCACQGKGTANRKGAGQSPGADSLSTRTNNGNDNNDAIPVEVAGAAIQTVSSYLAATATLEPKRIAQLLAETTGRVTVLHREEGDRVTEGQILIQLEDTQQRLDYEKACIDLEVADKDWKRAEELGSKGIVSTKDLDDARLRFETAKHAKARAEFELDKTTIVAPFSGIVTERNVHVGETVTPGKPVASVADFDPLVAKFRVPETEVGSVRIGQPVILEFPSGEHKTQQAKVSLVSPVIDEGTGTVKLTAYLNNPSFSIRPGTYVRARVISATHESALTVPKKALINEDDSHYVFVMASDTTARVEVEPGITDGQFVEILSGLAVGDTVITVGQGGLKSGDKVKAVR